MFSASEPLVVRQGLVCGDHTQDFVPTELATSSLCGIVFRKLGWRLFCSVTPGVLWSWPRLSLYSQVPWGCDTADVFREVIAVRARVGIGADNLVQSTRFSRPLFKQSCRGRSFLIPKRPLSFVLKTSQGIFKTLSTVLEARDHEARKGSTEECEAGGWSASLRLTGLHGTFQAVQGYTVRPCWRNGGAGRGGEGERGGERKQERRQPWGAPSPPERTKGLSLNIETSASG